MKEIDIILEMLKLQQSLNDETNGIGWEDGYTNKNKLISWKRCIYMECAELIDSFAWKHWKSINAPTNEQNLRIEVVDIWHFVMSLMLQIYHTNRIGDINTLAQNICSASGFARFCKEPLKVEEENIYEIINEIERLIHESSGFKYDIHNMLEIYFSVALKCGVNLYSLYECYIAKNILNRFRQNNGYKEGTYSKIWNSKEDNVVMSEILSNGLISIDEIYAALQSEYDKVKK
ncbi:dUTP diphosphatase [Campylobacter sp. RM9344]|uniref:dUTP diphosphatase n=1 Tax=Campylobacter californiensis TaxID=1032243 RepID=A0AAW3ZQU0_9BACT|nr:MULTISPECIES: dUTP diphosphatase [unclassified Campylobacter]MBE2984496.1 dUTP diphosphatase [Campylobacter sp. RM6883]MBE2985836.1 dUTP diphosphatase [Campylobacter sp. RM12919]MBE2987951.1 dUTP diphosphatase [Campylobacter sp. RM12920]MBE2994974.1 dUTP diphosphatase [Campylobacter sp. RM6913]MBE3021876.1 dUTP diphosphatase [Campylobacter sp. 7477a]MBE3028937.1 dUTP diphosphatase [Campylobacter sp. RM9344]